MKRVDVYFLLLATSFCLPAPPLELAWAHLKIFS